MEVCGISATILTVIGASNRTACNIHTLQQKVRNAPVILSLIRTEVLTIVTSLKNLEHTMKDQPNLLKSRFQSDDEGLEIFDSALTGCIMVISCIEFELEKLVTNDSMAWSTAFKYLWSESNVKELLQHLGGQTRALQLLLQSLEV